MDSSTPDTGAQPETPAAEHPKQARRPGVWAALAIVVLYFALQFGLGILIGAVVGLAAKLKAGLAAAPAHSVPPTTKSIVAAIQASPDLRVIVVVLTLTATAAVTAWLVHRLWPAQWTGAGLPGFGFTRLANPRAYLVAVLLGIVVLLLGGPLTQFLAGQHPIRQDVTLLAGSVSPGLRVLLALVVVGVAPFAEELVFRGVLLSGLARRMPIGWAVLASAVIFGCAHLPDFGFAWYPVPVLILLGLIAAWLRVRTHSLWPSIALHATNNAVAAVAWFVVAHR
jgi:membrane protease YdiL (CAAX protease family)